MKNFDSLITRDVLSLVSEHLEEQVFRSKEPDFQDIPDLSWQALLPLSNLNSMPVDEGILILKAAAQQLRELRRYEQEQERRELLDLG